jgi:hypothetical protein
MATKATLGDSGLRVAEIARALFNLPPEMLKSNMGRHLVAAGNDPDARSRNDWETLSAYCLIMAVREGD